MVTARVLSLCIHSPMDKREKKPHWRRQHAEMWDCTKWEARRGRPLEGTGTMLPAGPNVPSAGSPPQVCGAVNAAGTDLSTAVRQAVHDPGDSCPP